MNPQLKSLISVVRHGVESNVKAALAAMEKSRKKDLKAVKSRIETLRKTELQVLKKKMEDVRKSLDRHEALRPYLALVSAAAKAAQGEIERMTGHRPPAKKTRSAPRKKPAARQPTKKRRAR